MSRINSTRLELAKFMTF